MFCCCASAEKASELSPSSPAAATAEVPEREDEPQWSIEAAAAVAGKVPQAPAEAQGSAKEEVVSGPPSQVGLERAMEVPHVEDSDGLFEAILERGPSGAQLGVDVELSDGVTLYVHRVAGGDDSSARRYNESVPEEAQVRVGDCILEVNGCSGAPKLMWQELRDARRMELKLRRPKVAVHQLEKGGQTLGLDLHYAKSTTTLCIQRILEGAVLSSGADIREGDRIISVNGKEGSSLLLLDEIKRSDTVELRISRCPEVVTAYARGSLPTRTSPEDVP